MILTRPIACRIHPYGVQYRFCDTVECGASERHRWLAQPWLMWWCWSRRPTSGNNHVQVGGVSPNSWLARCRLGSDAQFALRFGGICVVRDDSQLHLRFALFPPARLCVADGTLTAAQPSHVSSRPH